MIRSGYAPEVISEGLERGDKVERTVWKRRTNQFLQLQWGVLSSMEEYVWVDNRVPGYLQRGINTYIGGGSFPFAKRRKGKQSLRKDHTGRFFNVATETMDYMLRCCAIEGGWTERAVMKEGGRGLMVMRKLLKRRSA